MRRAAFLALVAAPAWAAGEAPAASFGALLQSVAALGVVVVAIFAAAWALRRLQPGMATGQGPLRPVAAMAVGSRERVVIVEVQDTWLVLGVAPGAVNVIHTLPKGVAAGAAPEQGFAAWLRRARTGRHDA